MASTTSRCQGCGQDFASRNAVFRHLKETDGACLPAEQYQDFCTFVRDRQPKERVVLLYGYWPDETCLQHGQDAMELLIDMLEHLSSHGPTAPSATSLPGKLERQAQREYRGEVGYNPTRSYGHTSRGVDIVKQDKGTGAVTEVLTMRLAPLSTTSMDDWLNSINNALSSYLKAQNSTAMIRILGRQPMPISTFNAEMDQTHRRVDYLLPADFLFPTAHATNNYTAGHRLHAAKQRNEFFYSLPSFTEGSYVLKKNNLPTDQRRKPGSDALDYLLHLKKLMQSLATHVVELDDQDQVAIMEKAFHSKKRQRSRHGPAAHPTPTLESSTKASKHDHGDQARSKKSKAQPKKDHVLKRRRFHNFTPTLMAHEYLSYRRLDRVYHRCTLRFKKQDHDPQAATVPCFDEDHERPFLVISLSGDVFLQGQACRIVGVLIALARGLVDEDFVTCVFDESYPHLVPTPPAPSLGLYAGEAFYAFAEGKAQAILSARKTDRYSNGWNDDATLARVQDWQNMLRARVAHMWLDHGVDQDDRLIAEKNWVEQVLEPWALRAQEQLIEYRKWKLLQANEGSPNTPTEGMAVANAIVEQAPAAIEEVCLPPIESIDPVVPPLFEKVLYYLRQADATGQWPATTPKRQLVMVSNLMDGVGQETDKYRNFNSSLTVAHMMAKANKKSMSTAYDFAEGEGGASGSFSIGAMPGDKCMQPKANSMFPELMKAAFELEMLLYPNREPSSTIAVNRNAQFRPHTDSGAGAGQSTSLIVGLGTYVGGELVVEGEKKDIRYKAIEFNGWKQRHWTMPFKGERYSLVWFTPKGCEGVRGIDLCK